MVTLDVDGVEVLEVYYEDKKRAVIECLKSGRGFTIKELRACAGRSVPVSDKVVSRIVRELELEGVVVKVYKWWFHVESLLGGARGEAPSNPPVAVPSAGLRALTTARHAGREMPIGPARRGTAPGI